ncbi:MAG: hypothetical protein HY769_07475 [Candidatus Stahlbacteria bacterium]|nr:hypothetical protein [Candidatus Stahlbacteria bacterium]
MKNFFYFWLSVFGFQLFLGCAEDPLLFRAGADYFPLKVGNTWDYLQVQTGDTINLRVTDTTTILARECWLLERNGIPEYWWKDNARIDRFYYETIFVNGVEDTIVTAWVPWIHIPLVLGESWDYQITQQKIILCDTIRTQLYVASWVEELKNGNYMVEIKVVKNRTSNTFGLYCDTTLYHESYKPNIGLTKREVNQLQEYLVNYSLH